MDALVEPVEILDFWFGAPGGETYGQNRPVWWKGDPDFDDEVRRRFRSTFDAGAAGRLEVWEETPEGALALTILLDQFSHAMYRGQAGAFSADPLARKVARRAIENGFDRRFTEVHRWFFYLPFEHSEELADQEYSVSLFSELEPGPGKDMTLDFAIRHQRVIQRFGRFPNRNAALGRESTPEELAFLASPEAPY